MYIHFIKRTHKTTPFSYFRPSAIYHPLFAPPCSLTEKIEKHKENKRK